MFSPKARRMRLKSARALHYFGHLLLATFAVTVAVFGVGYPLAAALDPQGRAINYFFVAPGFVMPAAIGLLGGYFLGWRLAPLASRLIPLPPLALVICVLYVAAREWALFFGTSCFMPDCYFQFEAQAMVTAPLVAACAYAMGSEFGRRRNGRKSSLPVRVNWRRRVYIGSIVAVVVTLSLVQRLAHHGSTTVRVNWNEVTGFQGASVEDPIPSRWLRIIVAPLDQSVILQSKPHIASDMRLDKVTRATGCVIPVTLAPLPVVLGISHLTDSPCLLHVSGLNEP
jgi:hypothetical protein